MKRTLSEYNTRIVINAAFATLSGEGIIVYWPDTEESFIATDIANANDATADNTVGTYDKWAVTSDILIDCHEFMDDLSNEPIWPEENQSRDRIIAQNGNTGEHYGK